MKISSRLLLRLCESTVVFCLAAMLVLVFVNVALRYGFNSGLSVSDEAARYLFVWLTFIGAVIALRDNAHLGVDLLSRHLPPLPQRLCAVCSEVLMLFCCALFFIGSLKQALMNMGNLSPVAGIPLGLMYAAGVVCSLGMAAIILHRLYLLLFRHVEVGSLVPPGGEQPLAQESRP